MTASSPAAITYGTAVPAVTSTTPTGGWTTAPTCGVYANAASNTALTGVQNAGTYVTKCAGGVALNYSNITYVNGSLTINPAALTVTAASGSQTYGTALPAIGYTTNPTPVTFTTNPTCGVYATAASTTALTGVQPAGSYVTKCSGAVNTNYTITYVNGTYTINPNSVTVTAATGTQAYGTALPAISFTTNPTPTTFTTNPTCGVYATAASTTALTGVQNAGSYVTKCSGGVEVNGATLTYVNGTFTITKSTTATTVTASSPAAITYGAALPTVTASTPTGGWTTAPTCGVYRTAAAQNPLTGVQNAGTYVTKCAGGVAVNYSNITYANGSLTINKAPVVITAQSRTGTRGGAIPTPTFTSNPTAATYTTQPICRVYNTSDTTFATPLTGNFPNAAGTYVTHCSGAVSTNYTPSYVNGTITVA